MCETYIINVVKKFIPFPIHDVRRFYIVLTVMRYGGKIYYSIQKGIGNFKKCPPKILSEVNNSRCWGITADYPEIEKDPVEFLKNLGGLRYEPGYANVYSILKINERGSIQFYNSR